MEHQSLAAIVVAIVSGIFGLAGTVATAIANRKAKAAEQQMERTKLDGLTAVDMSRVVVEAQRAVTESFQAQFDMYHARYTALENNLQQAQTDISRVRKDADNKLRLAQVALQRAEGTSLLLARQISKLQTVLDSIRFNLVVLGNRIEDIQKLLPAGHHELHLKVDELARIHATVVTSLDSVELSAPDEDFEALITIEKVMGPTN